MEDLPPDKFEVQLKSFLAIVERKVVGSLGGAYKGSIDAMQTNPNEKTEIHNIVAAISFREGRFTAQVRVCVVTAAQGGAELSGHYNFDSWVDADKGAPEQELDEKQVEIPSDNKPTFRSFVQ